MGPGPADDAQLTTALPVPADVLAFAGRASGWGARVRLRSVTISADIATVDFSPELQAFGCGAERARSIREQIVRTLRLYAGVREVRITVAGVPADMIQPSSPAVE